MEIQEQFPPKAEHEFIIEKLYIYKHYRLTQIPHFILIFQDYLGINNNELAFLAQCYAFEDEQEISIDVISDRMGVCKRTVKRYIKDLSRRNKIDIIYRIIEGDEIKYLSEPVQGISENWQYISCIYDLTPIEKEAFQLAKKVGMVTEQEAMNTVSQELRRLGYKNVDIQITQDNISKRLLRTGEAEKETLEQETLSAKYVYIITDGEFYKIGITKNVESRLKSFQTANPKTLEVIFSEKVDEPKKIEEKIHNRFNEQRTSGEWFELSKSDIEMIQAYLSFHSV